MKVKYHKNFLKDLSKLKNKNIAKTLKNILNTLKNTDNIKDISNIKKLKGYKNYYRIRIGNYRLGFRLLSENEIILDVFLHRKDIYKNYP